MQQTLAATNSEEQVESAPKTCRIEPHMIGVQLTEIVNPEMLSLRAPTAKDASVYPTVVKRVEVDRGISQISKSDCITLRWSKISD